MSDSKSLGQVAYEGYSEYSGGKSLISGQPLPVWDHQSEDIQNAWESAALNIIRTQALEQYDTKTRDGQIQSVKAFRQVFDTLLQELRKLKEAFGKGDAGRQCALSCTHLEDVNLRLGLTLKALGTENPYPNSKNPENTIIDPTADGVKY